MTFKSSEISITGINVPSPSFRKGVVKVIGLCHPLKQIWVAPHLVLMENEACLIGQLHQPPDCLCITIPSKIFSVQPSLQRSNSFFPCSRQRGALTANRGIGIGDALGKAPALDTFERQPVGWDDML